MFQYRIFTCHKGRTELGASSLYSATNLLRANDCMYCIVRNALQSCTDYNRRGVYASVKWLRSIRREAVRKHCIFRAS